MNFRPFIDWIQLEQTYPSVLVRREMNTAEFEQHRPASDARGNLLTMPEFWSMSFVGPRPSVIEHLNGIPVIDGGVIIKVERDEETGQYKDDPEWVTNARKSCRGSYESHVMVKSDGTRLILDGNIGRWNRPDNLFSLDLHDTIEAAQRFVQALGVGQGFTVGDRMDKTDYADGHRQGAELTEYDRKHGLTYYYTGARINKLHLTQNFVTGSAQNAEAFMSWLQTQSAKRIKRNKYASSGVAWGSKGRRVYLKAYIKHLEMLAHCKQHGLSKEQVLNDPVYQFCLKNGVVRFEAEYGDSFLKENHLHYLGECTMQKLTEHFSRHVSEITDRVRDDITTIDPSSFDVPAGCLAAAMAYLRGEDVRAAMILAGKERTFRNYAKRLKQYGLDINEPLQKDQKLTAVIKVVEIMPLNDAPNWYWQHQERMTAQAANDSTKQVAA
ncbi:phage/plasmid replication domain-containing protein [Chitinilyticum litopenaei]|uniref:phage/plasmid replication domain-containing protein n=1 Tax=Chitinilyticum litopenaei TaxID=1121276 RepID=UPI000490F78A|nr:phage/plasmid replication protein [Chitinilyticum litopenaei]